ncbi:MAG: hypothetical protein ACR2KL_08450 [Nocardioidaceae bacterium]
MTSTQFRPKEPELSTAVLSAGLFLSHRVESAWRRGRCCARREEGIAPRLLQVYRDEAA